MITKEVKEILDQDIKNYGKEVVIEKFKNELEQLKSSSYTEEQKSIVREICEEALEYLAD